MLETLPELAELLLYVLGSAGLSVAGISAERFALASLLSGDTVVGIWAVVGGGVLLYVASQLAGDKLLPKIAEFRSAAEGE